MFYNEKLVVFHSVQLISSQICFLIINSLHNLRWAYALPEGASKGRRQTKYNRGGIFLCLHLSAMIFGHNLTHVLRQSLTSFSVFKQGTRLSKSSTTSRQTFPTAISHLFSMKISVLMTYNDESAS